jgi:hypothetical protein
MAVNKLASLEDVSFIAVSASGRTVTHNPKVKGSNPAIGTRKEPLGPGANPLKLFMAEIYGLL